MQMKYSSYPREVQILCGRLAQDFIQLSLQEVLFCMGIQAMGYEKYTRWCPDHAMAYYSLIKTEGEGTSDDKLDEAIQQFREAGGAAWLDNQFPTFQSCTGVPKQGDIAHREQQASHTGFT